MLSCVFKSVCSVASKFCLWYLQRKYLDIIDEPNGVIRFWNKVNSLRVKKLFLQFCFSFNVLPFLFKRRSLKIKIESCFPGEQAFINYELDKILNPFFSSVYISRVYVCIVLLCPKSGTNYLSLIFRFWHYLASNRFEFEKRINLKNRKYLNSLISRWFTTKYGDLNRHIFDFFNVTFTGIECPVLLRDWIFTPTPSR